MQQWVITLGMEITCGWQVRNWKGLSPVCLLGQHTKATLRYSVRDLRHTQERVSSFLSKTFQSLFDHMLFSKPAGFSILIVGSKLLLQHEINNISCSKRSRVIVLQFLRQYWPTQDWMARLNDFSRKHCVNCDFKNNGDWISPGKLGWVSLKWSIGSLT